MEDVICGAEGALERLRQKRPGVMLPLQAIDGTAAAVVAALGGVPVPVHAHFEAVARGAGAAVLDAGALQQMPARTVQGMLATLRRRRVFYSMTAHGAAYGAVAVEIRAWLPKRGPALWACEADARAVRRGGSPLAGMIERLRGPLPGCDVFVARDHVTCNTRSNGVRVALTGGTSDDVRLLCMVGAVLQACMASVWPEATPERTAAAAAVALSAVRADAERGAQGGGSRHVLLLDALERLSGVGMRAAVAASAAHLEPAL